MGWWGAIGVLIVALLEFLGSKLWGSKRDWVKQEIHSKPKDDVV